MELNDENQQLVGQYEKEKQRRKEIDEVNYYLYIKRVLQIPAERCNVYHKINIKKCISGT